MRYFGKEVEVVKKRKLEYITCDCCKKKIKANEDYFHLYFNDQYYEGCTTTYNEDLCKDCLQTRVAEIVKEMKTFTCELEISGKMYFADTTDEYDKHEDKLIDGMIKYYESESN